MLLTFFLILFSSVIFYTSAWAFTPGDANEDGDVNLGDIIRVVNIVFKGAPYPQDGEQADPTADCKINLSDAVYLVNYIFKSGKLPDWTVCFDVPVNLGTPINSADVEESFFITYDGKRAYFASNKPLTFGGSDLFYSDWDSVTGNWGAPVNLGPGINSGWDDITPCVSSDAKRLYFQAFGRAGGLGGWDVWYCEWDSINDQWGIPQNPGPNINSSEGEGTPFVTVDGQELYFVGPGGLYVSCWTGSEWGPRDYLDTMVNNYGNEAAPSLPADENWLYHYAFGYPTILVSYWTGTAWSYHKELLININPGLYPYITPDGKRLYFTGFPGGIGGSSDIWVAARKFQNK